MAQFTFIFQATLSMILLPGWDKTGVIGGQIRQDGAEKSASEPRLSAPRPNGSGRLQQQTSSDTQLVTQVLAALDNTIGYYEKNYPLLNFDGIFGAKVVEGRVVKLATPHLHEKDPEYMKRLWKMFQLSWDIGHSHRTVDMSLLWSSNVRHLGQTETFNELESDHCMAELLEPANGVMCWMTESCQRMMTKPGRQKYTLNHQILYTMVAEMSGCGSRLEQWLVKHKRSESVEQLQGELCSNLYSEAHSLAAAMLNDNNLKFRDLLLEMEFVCGMLGYVEFLKRDWLMAIFEWQSESGCFTATKPHLTVGRKLLIEEMLSDGCLSHLTAVAAAALSVHLHYLLYPGQGTAKIKAVGANISPPSLVMQPPVGSFPLDTGPGVFLNQVLYREDVPVGLNRVAEQDKSLEDKADVVLKHLETVKKKESVTQSVITQLSSRPGDVTRHSKLAIPEQAVPLAQHLSSTASGTTVHSSMGPFYFVIASIAMVMLVMLRYVHAKRRAHSMFRNRFRL
ncbi:UPF0764 protein C16orf89-like 2 [Homarus americanus]|uniref:UPF0764 protein C16orf89-like 2 n=1 Tax=Homarus americanus TaxID=6706 RepID=A0A8J5MYC4_HOMAM|nr:UPF0764 protein C16orf89-like 2 [Homarus americanus]